MSRRRLSVVIPTWNQARLVGEAVSALGQEGRDLEVMVVDDGSTDGTAEVIERRFGKSVKLLRMATRSGVGAARDEGEWQATGDLLAFLDSDDLWLPGKLKAELDALERFPDAEASVSDSRFIVEGQFIRTSRFAENGALAATGECLEPSGSMIHPGCGRYPVMGLDLWDHAVPSGRHQARPTLVRHGPPFVRRLGLEAGLYRNAASWPCPRCGRTSAGSTTVRASGERAPGSPESRAGNWVAARSTDRHREIDSAGPTHGGSGECGELPISHLIGLARLKPLSLNAVDQGESCWPS